MDEDNFVRLLQKYAINRIGHDIHEEINEEHLYEILVEMGANWKIVWESIPTDGVFDALYAENPAYEAFLYYDKIYERYEGEWAAPSSDVMEWLIYHPPFDCCTFVADLFLHSQGVSAGASPWLLFQYIIGAAITSQGMGLNSLMGIGANDGIMLGRALEAWGDYTDIVDPYIGLLIEYGAEEG